MGSAGIRPKGDDRSTARWSPGGTGDAIHRRAICFFTYWMDMKRDQDGNYWGNMLGPAGDERLVPARPVVLPRTHDPGQRSRTGDGELAAWIDGKLYIHYTGFRWLTPGKTEAFRHRRLRPQRAGDNTVWYDDVVPVHRLHRAAGVSSAAPNRYGSRLFRCDWRHCP